jgi:hypothetical protein
MLLFEANAIAEAILRAYVEGRARRAMTCTAVCLVFGIHEQNVVDLQNFVVGKNLVFQLNLALKY